MTRLSRSEIKEWLKSPTTEIVLQAVQERIDEEIQELLNGGSLDMESVENTALYTARRTGFLDGLSYFMSLGEEDE